MTPERVYPRACGGTSRTRSGMPATKGLSPRVRGNLVDGSLTVTARGSIPARAGEPENSIGDFVTVGVYPRACGGTSIISR